MRGSANASFLRHLFCSTSKTFELVPDMLYRTALAYSTCGRISEVNVEHGAQITNWHAQYNNAFSYIDFKLRISLT